MELYLGRRPLNKTNFLYKLDLMLTALHSSSSLSYFIGSMLSLSITMQKFIALRREARRLHAYLSKRLFSLGESLWHFTKCSFQFIVLHSDPFTIQLLFFVSVSFAGFLALKFLKPKPGAARPKDLDLFFMSVSALTVSSMGTVEMEVFSNSQLWVLILLMLVGGEVFTSMLGLQFMKTLIKIEGSIEKRVEFVVTDVESPNLASIHDQKAEHELKSTGPAFVGSEILSAEKEYCLRYDAMRCLRSVVLGYLMAVNTGGSILISLYLSLVPEAKEALRTKKIPIWTFSVFTAISSFGNCGFTPANENMMIFKKNSGLLLLVIPQILAGNTLFPPCLRFVLWVLKKLTGREEFIYILQHQRSIRYKHLLSLRRCVYLALTVLGFIAVQMALFCALEWNSEALQGLNSYEKTVGALFQSVNSRHAGESIVDLSTLSQAVLVLYVVMMYLPPYTSFLPVKNEKHLPLDRIEAGGARKIIQSLIMSQLSYLVIFTILICITERKALSTDPLNFNVLNIVFEVTSAYGNVGFSTGYSCQRLLKPDSSCRDASYGFVGKWTKEGKVILIMVMLFGRLKKFNMGGGKAWELS